MLFLLFAVGQSWRLGGFSPTKVVSVRLSLVWVCQSASHADETDSQHPAELKTLADRYDITINSEHIEFPVRTQHGLIAGETASPDELAKYTPLLVKELSLYPANLVANAKLKRIILCKELSFDGQRRTAVPDFEHDDLYLDVARQSNKRFYLNKVFHHEFYHIVDYRDDGLLYADKRWVTLNRADFQYGTGGKNAQHLSDTSLLTTAYPGFLNHYSTTGVEEDKAEMFANLIVEPRHVAEQMEKDTVLKAKVECLKDELHSFCAELDEKFWKQVNAVQQEP